MIIKRKLIKNMLSINILKPGEIVEIVKDTMDKLKGDIS
jgi:hypothetical protein